MGHGPSLVLGWAATQAETALDKEWTTELSPVSIAGEASQWRSCTRTWVCC